MCDIYIKKKELKLISQWCATILQSDNFHIEIKSIARTLQEKVDKRLPMKAYIGKSINKVNADS